MPRKKRQSKTGGRQAGTPNKVTSELRIRIKEFLDSRFDEVLKAWDKLDSYKKVSVYERYLNYVLPKELAASIDMTTENKNELHFPPIIYIGDEEGTRTIEYEGNEEEYMKTLIKVDPTGKHLHDGTPTILHIEYHSDKDE